MALVLMTDRFTALNGKKLWKESSSRRQPIVGFTDLRSKQLEVNLKQQIVSEFFRNLFSTNYEQLTTDKVSLKSIMLLLADHHGHIGSVLVPMLTRAGHRRLSWKKARLREVTKWGLAEGRVVS